MIEPIDPNNYRDVCWVLEERGGVGETALHICLLMASSIHADLAKRMLGIFPKLINDIYLSEEYYGNNVSKQFPYLDRSFKCFSNE